MKLLIFGATGRIGRQLIDQALAKGYRVTAFTRNHSKLESKHPQLKVITGDVLDVRQVLEAVDGQEAILCSLGAGRKGNVRAAGTKHIIEAMEKAGVRRLICQTTLGAGDSQGNLNFFWKHLMFGLLLKEAFADHVRQEKHVMESSLDWTIVRPGAFTEGPLTGVYRHVFPPTDKTTRLKISCADVAHFMLNQLKDASYLRKTPGLSY